MHANGTTRNRRKPFIATVGVALMVAGSMFAAAPANADTGADPAVIEAALANVGVLGGGGSQARALSAETPEQSQATVTVDGLSIEGDSSSLTMTPVANGDGTVTDNGVAVFGHTADSAFALTSSDQGANAGYSVLLGAAAPTSYSYDFQVNGQPAALEANDDGSVTVFDASGNAVNFLAPAWAKDANGADVATSYIIEGSTVTQIVSTTAETAYPVVADPRLQCDGLWCTVELTRAETGRVADNALNASILCTFIPAPGVPVCGVIVAGAWAHANIARSNGQCTGYRVWQANFISYAHLAYISCYA